MSRVLRVLQVEDSPDDAELILRELRRAGYDLESQRVETSVSMVNALCDRDWDLVLSDYELPGFGGLEALRVLRASGMDLPFLVVSGAIGEEIAVATMKAGAHDYVFKGNLARLGPAIERELKEADLRRRQTASDRALRESEERYRALFEHSPMPIFMENFAGVQQLFEAHRKAGVTDFRAFFLEHPEAVRSCAAAVQIVDVNQRSVSFFGCQRKEEVRLHLPSYLLEGSWPIFREELITLAEGGLCFDCEIPIRGVKGETRVVSLHLSVSPGFEKSLGRVLISFSDITQRIEMEQSLREARASLERAQGMAHLGSWEWDPARELPHWSPELYRIFGLDPLADAPSHDRFTDRVHPEDRALVLGALETVIAEGQPRSFEYRIVRADGAVRHVHELAEVIPGPERRLRGTIQDITARTQAELALRASETRFGTLVENAPVGIYLTDAQGQCEYVNSSWCGMAGMSSEEASGDGWMAGLHPEDRAPIAAHWKQMVTTGGALGHEYRFRNKAGKITWVYGYATQLLDSSGHAIGYIGINVDITERKVAEAALQAAKVELERFFRLMPDPVCVASTRGYFTKVNPVWSQLLGYSEEELLSRPLTDFIHPEDVGTTLQEMERQLAGSATANFINRYRAQDGSYRWLEWHSSAAVAGQFFAAARDITERRQLEAVLKDMERLSAKGQMAAYIAHEINNPLAGIKNAFALIEGAIPASHPHFQYTALIKREIDRIAGIIRTMYHVYRPQNATIADVPLLEAFQDIQSLLVPKCRAAKVDIDLELPERGFAVRMNPGLLRQVLFNLVQNAVEASPAEGVVTLRAVRSSGAILITVADMGQGIPPEWAGRIFEAGFTTKQDSGMSGLGLGLSACRNILESIGGTLDFQPRASGQGVQFRICLPDAQT
jgi:PAS domain S-box-containing protein